MNFFFFFKSQKCQFFRCLFLFLIVASSTKGFAENDASADLPLWYWRQKSFVNFGDYLSLKIVERMTGKKIREYFRKPADNEQKLLALGSIISFADRNDVIWGSGINGKITSPETYFKLHPETWDVRAVRGPLTRNFLMKKLKIKCPEIYGDPALLIPRLFPEFKRKEKPSRPYTIIIHYADIAQFPRAQNQNIVYATDPWDQVIEKILDSEFVISSSMHGVIVAEAFGIPARLLRISETEPLFKFHDYYLGTGRQTFQPAHSVEEALRLGGEPPVQIDLDKLYMAFPFEFYELKKEVKKTCQSPPLSSYLDLEAEGMLADFILETKKIEIPGFPDAFNPSVVKWKDSALMCFRTGDSHYASDTDPSIFASFLMSFRRHGLESYDYTNEIGLVFLDGNLNPVGEPQLLTIQYEDPYIEERQQDPRLITINNRLFMVYSNMISGKVAQVIRRMFMVELFFDGKLFFAGKPVAILNFEGENEQRWQKNWVAFEYNKELLLSYSINPHFVLKPNMENGNCTTQAKTKTEFPWEWGVLRGGTPAILDNGEYLAFFHSSKEIKTQQTKGKKYQHYFMGGYTFSAKPPFELTKITTHPIIGKGFYNGDTYEGKTWKPLRVVFPGGFYVDNNFIWVFYGRQDHETWVTKLDKNKFYDSLVQVKN